MRHLQEVVAEGELVEGNSYKLHRWPADDKLSDPVTKPVATADES